MNEKNHTVGGQTKRRFNLQEKQDYCAAWEKTELKQVEFCKANGISCSALKRWCHEFKQEANNFAPVMVTEHSSPKQEERIPVEIRLANQLQIGMAVQAHQLIFLIQELQHATAIIR